MVDRFQGQYRWLSNFWPAVVTLDGIEYATVENAYQASKMASPTIRELIGKATPGQAKRMTKTAPYLEQATRSDEVRIATMDALVGQKFRLPEFKALLLATGDEQIQEGNTWHDRFWGVCLCDKHQGTGQNVLGRMLMHLRAELR